jgi:Putative DNA-binding domain
VDDFYAEDEPIETIQQSRRRPPDFITAPPGDDLQALQRWMLAGITGRRSADPTTLVKDTPGLPARDRLDIHTRGYLAKLVGHLRGDYPMLRAHLGDDLFDLFATAYIHARPPSSYSLFHLGDGFPAYLEHTQPPNAAAGLPAAIARLERAGTFTLAGAQT